VTAAPRPSAGQVRVLPDDCYADRTALVTGAGSGIGRAVALRLVELGASVIGVGRRLPPLLETAGLASVPDRMRVETLNIRDRPAAHAFVSALPSLDLLVNNAGGQFVAAASSISPRGFGSVLDLNLTATAALIDAARPALAAAGRRTGGGRVVSLSLSAPERGIAGLAHSTTARAAIAGFTATAARAWHGEGIRLFCLAPGTVRTAGVADEVAGDVLDRAVAHSLLGRDTSLAEVAEWVAALGSGVLDVFSGTLFEIDGGSGLADAASCLLATDG
jgi:citronellol/citronellal dehydrogenase